MITLAFDSTAKAASVAVHNGERLLGSFNIDNGLTHSELLLPMAEDLLKNLGITFSEIELLACTTGPGSFTGVRIGTALVKGIAFAKNTPCVSVSTLEALAENLAPLSAIIVPVMDARRGQFYTAVFDATGADIKRLTDDLALSAEELAELLKGYTGKDIYLVGDGYAIAHKKLTALGIRLCETPELLINENAASAAKVALRKYALGEYTTDTALMPTYLRMPQAERERLEREKIKDGE